jgi:hypothetical protein
VKIEIEIPDWADGRHVYVFAGIELAAFKHAGAPWRVKSSRCSMCGKCCEGCIHLTSDGPKRVCELGMNRPFACGTSAVPNRVSECTERYREL